VLVLSHVREIIEQDAEAIRELWPNAPIGINSAGLRRRDTQQQIILATVQSIYRAPLELGAFDLIIVDEAHLTPQSGDGMYLRVFAALRELRPGVRILGATATVYRLDYGRLDEGEDRLFDRVVHAYGIGQAVKDGWLAPLVARGGDVEIDVTD